MPDIFLSYAHEDEPQARLFAGLLQSAGFSVFWDRNIPTGQTWREFIGQGLQEARCLVVLWSSRSVQSHWVIDEADEGRRRGILVPVAIESIEMPLGFRSIQCADLSDDQFQPGAPKVQRLLDDIRRVLGGRTGAGATPGPVSAETRYRERLVRALSKTRLLGAADEVDIESLFTEVHFLPDASATRRYGVASTSFSDFSDLVDRRKNERFKALDALKDSDRLYILGTPGAGKSTFLKHVAVSAATGKIPGFPIFVSLKDWADTGQDFFAFVREEFSTSGFDDPGPYIERLLQSGSALLLLDGLDEVGTHNDSRARVVKAIVEISRKYERARILLTCRTSANDHAFNHFRYVEVADFQAEQQVSFVQKWFDKNPKRGELFLEQFNGDNSRALRDLGRKPLFLAFLCVAFDQTLEFPRTKSALYAEAIDVLLSKWDSSRSIQRESYGLKGAQRKKQFLAQLAFRTFELDQYGMSELMIDAVMQRFVQRLPGSDQAMAEVESGALARSFEAAHGILVERAVGIFAFSHLSIHEYFAAQGLVNAVASGVSWDKLVAPEAIHSSRWREVLLHVGTLLHDGEPFVEFLRRCIGAHVKKHPDVRMLLDRCGFVADNEDMFSAFSSGPVQYLKKSSDYREGFAQDFYPSDRLSNSITRFERAILYNLKQYREQQKPPPASLAKAWRKLEVLRETVSFKHGLALLVGVIGNAERLDTALADYVDSQDLFLVLLDDVLIADRNRARNMILGTMWG